jgi:hypothetical protein
LSSERTQFLCFNYKNPTKTVGLSRKGLDSPNISDRIEASTTHKDSKMRQVNIIKGEYRGTPVSGIFTLLKEFKKGAINNFVTVVNDGTFQSDTTACRVNVESENDFVYIDEDTVINEVETVVESDEDAMDRIATRFQILDEMAAAATEGNIRALIVTGPPGVGKSFGVMTQLEKSSMFDRIAGNRVRYEVVKGAVTALGLYAQLYKYSDPKNVLVFDDSDSIFGDELSLNILKAALDSGKQRRIFWNSDSHMLRREGIPEYFDFKGSIIFITNLNLDGGRSKKMLEHMAALQSRCHFLDLTINTDRDRMLRILQVHRDAPGGLFADYDFANDEGDQILEFMKDNSTKLREVSLRCALKIADLVKISPVNWKTLAASTVCK